MHITLPTTQRQHGFTLPEMILTIAVLGIVMAMLFPDMSNFFKRQKVEQEARALEQINKALDAYAKEQTQNFSEGNYVTLPCPNGNLAACNWGALAPYANMTADEIVNDIWGNPREFIATSDNMNYRDGNFDVYYVSVRSNGPNTEDDTASAYPSWPNGRWSNVQQLGSYEAQRDDLLVKFNDTKLKTELFEETLRRMDRIVEALDRYAQARYNEALLTDDQGQGNVGNKLFYPPEEADFLDGTGRNAAAGFDESAVGSWYGILVREDVEERTNPSSTSLESASGDEASRLAAMMALMRILGLPEDFAKDALTNTPFYYYSNPCPDQASERRKSPPYMPPKVTINPLPGNCN